MLHMEDAELLARKVRALRGGATQKAFARKLGVSQATLARLESGAQNTTIKTLQQICKALRCDVSELFRGK
jgi:transcriptional regulator with XRE-family HTH domain